MCDSYEFLPPPADFDSRQLKLRQVSPDTPLWRIYPVEYDPFHYPPDGEGRFNDPEENFGVFYVSLSPLGAFVETLARDLKDESPANRNIEDGDYADRRLAKLSPATELTVADLTVSPVLLRLGTDESIWSLPYYERTREWARAIWEHPTDVDGILYPARHAKEHPSIAVFESFHKGKFVYNSDNDTRIQLEEMPQTVGEYADMARLGWNSS